MPVLNVPATSSPVAGVQDAINLSLDVPGSAAIVDNKRRASGQATLTSAATTIATGLNTVTACAAVMESDPILTCDRVTAQVGNQSGAPVAGSIILKAWMPTGAAATTPVAATGFAGIVVNWTAVGT